MFFRNDRMEEMHSESGDILYIVIPAYNEADNIMRVIEGWYPVIEKHNGNGMSRLVVIDDGSTDETYQILCEFANARPLMEVLTRANAGHGPTVLYGYHYALKCGADYIFQTDSDGQTLPAEFEDFWKVRTEHDMIIGWRAQRQDGSDRVFVTRTLRTVIRLTFGVDCKDANTPFRLMDAETLEDLIEYIPHDAFLANVLLTVLYTKRGKNILYLPITFRPRQGGVNSINKKKIIQVGKKAWKQFRRLNKEWK